MSDSRSFLGLGNGQRLRRLFLERLEDRSLLAAVITVNSTADGDTRDTVLTLREAVLVNNRTLAVGTLTAAEQAQVVGTPSDTDADTINVPAGTYTLTIIGSDDNAATGDLDITDSATIVGAAAATTIIQAGPAPGSGIDRVFHIVGVPTVSMSNVTIRHGFLSEVGTGGGIRNENNLTLTDTVVTQNQAERGAGIYHTAEGTLTITRSTISLNTGDKGGGILNNFGDVVITDSTIADNIAFTQGGGILNTGSNLSLTGSTVSGNEAGEGGGGGIFNRASLTITNSTISGNTAIGGGGGISNTGGGSADLLNVTITDNTTGGEGGEGGEGGDGGGIFNPTDNTFEVRNTIIAGNSDTGGEGPDAFGTFISLGFNLVQDTTGVVITGDGTGDITGADPLLESLASNGGFTQTHALLPGSPAIDAADPENFPETDQRGVERPQGSGPDIGAFEVTAAPTGGLPDCEVITSNSTSFPGTARLANDADNPGGGALIVTGTAGNDVIVIDPRPGNNSQIRVRRNGQLLGTFSRSAVQHIVVFGLAGNDVIVVNATLTQSATLLGNAGNDLLFGGRGADGLDGGAGNDRLFGGAGDDTLCGGDGNDFVYGQAGDDLVGGDAGNDFLFGAGGNDLLLGGDGDDFLYGGLGGDLLFGQAGNDYLFGEAGNDIVVGGGGNDRLFGGTGRDLAIGGEGADLLFGEADDDILVAGSTAHDEDPEALLAILAEWTSGRSYGTRVNNIRLGGGANGAVTLDEATVIDDGASDQLWGGGGLDAFAIGVGDKIKDKSRNERVN